MLVDPWGHVHNRKCTTTENSEDLSGGVQAPSPPCLLQYIKLKIRPEFRKERKTITVKIVPHADCQLVGLIRSNDLQVPLQLHRNGSAYRGGRGFPSYQRRVFTAGVLKVGVLSPVGSIAHN